MSRDRSLDLAERWFRLLLRFYPRDFRDDMGDGMVEAYRDRAREARRRRGLMGLFGVCLRALIDSMRSGPRERSHPAASWRRGGTWRDAGMAARRLMRSPSLVIATVATLTVGLGTFATVYTAVHKILIEPMPYKDPDDLYFVWRDYTAYFDFNRGWLGGTDVAELQRTGGVIESAVGLRRQRITFALREGADPTEIAVIYTSPNLFDVLGVSPRLGRGFAPTEVGPNRAPVIVLTHDLFRRLGGDPSIIGGDVRLNGEPHTVIGVLPPTFSFMVNASLGPPQTGDAYVTFAQNLSETNPNNGSFAGLIRARRGSAPEVVTAAVNAVGRAIDARDFKGRGLKLYPLGLGPDLVAAIRPALIVLAFAGGFLVLVLMVNLGSVLLARAAEREHEFAVSRALGANGLAVARVMLLEGGLLGFVSGITSAVVAFWSTTALVALAPLDLPRRDAIAVDWSIAVTIVGTGVLLGVLAAIAPAAWAARASLSSLLAASAVRGGGSHGRLRQGMVVAQVALTLVLLIAGALVVRSLEQLLRADPGFTPERLLSLRLPIPTQLVAEARDALALQDRVERALAAIPGVRAVGATSALPLTATASQQTISIPGAPGNTGDADRDAPLVDYIGVRAGYIEAMRMRVVAGRSFEAARRDEVREAMIDTHLARQFFPNSSPLGAKIPYGEKQQLTIVGVVEQARLYDVHRDGRPQLIVRGEDWGYRTMAFVLRTASEPTAVIPDVRAAIRRIDSRLAIAEVQPMEDIVNNALRQQRISAVLIAGFAVGGLVLSAMGLFGVIAGSVTRRRHELAVRLALGANHRLTLRLVLAEGAGLVALGIAIGAPGIYAVSGLLRGMLVGISPFDPPTFVAVVAGLASVAIVACYVPARRVLSIEPAQSLRQS